jgi:hypothetical protein
MLEIALTLVIIEEEGRTGEFRVNIRRHSRGYPPLAHKLEPQQATSTSSPPVNCKSRTAKVAKQKGTCSSENAYSQMKNRQQVRKS